MGGRFYLCLCLFLSALVGPTYSQNVQWGNPAEELRTLLATGVYDGLEKPHRDQLAMDHVMTHRRLRQSIAEHERQLREFRRNKWPDGIGSPALRGRLRRATQLKLARAEKSLRWYTSGEPTVRSWSPQDNPFRVGWLGTTVREADPLAYYEFHCQQVVDEKNALAKLGREWVWIEDMDTSQLVDGRPFIIDDLIEVVGTKMYTTVDGGSNTVFVLHICPYVSPIGDDGAPILPPWKRQEVVIDHR